MIKLDNGCKDFSYVRRFSIFYRITNNFKIEELTFIGNQKSDLWGWFYINSDFKNVIYYNFYKFVEECFYNYNDAADYLKNYFDNEQHCFNKIQYNNTEIGE